MPAKPETLSPVVQDLVDDLHVKYLASDGITIEQLYEDVDRIADMLVILAKRTDEIAATPEGDCAAPSACAEDQG